MISTTWRKRLAIWRSRLYLYPPPDAMPHTRLFWVSMGLVTLLAALFSIFFIAFLTSGHNAYLTVAEDMGNMDQAVWSVIHGQLLHQTICNIVSDTNCYSPAGVSRLAIHFEPMLFPISLFYLVWPGPNTLLVIQTLVVASGAFPAFWLARLRLRSNLAAVPFALLYLLYPAQQQATISQFHAVTFTAALLLFTLYFMYTRRTAWLFVFAILSMACKEEIPLVIAMFGLWSIVFQQRWRSGLILVLLAGAWLGAAFLSYRIFSPTGHPLLDSRYTYLGTGPVDIARNILLHPVSILKQHVWERQHRNYLRILLAPAGYLPLLAPWVFVLAIPSLAVNLLSSSPNQYLGIYQYSAEIVPVLVFSTIEAVVLIIWLVQWTIERLQERQGQNQSQNTAAAQPVQLARAGRLQQWVRPALFIVLIGFVLVNVVREDVPNGSLPFSQGFSWPQVTAHDMVAQQLIDMIPSTASVSAQSNLVPHLSERTNIYLFPYADDRADYIFLDVTNYTYPLYTGSFNHEVKQVLFGGNYGVVAAKDGYLLLKRGLPAPGIAPNSPVQSGDGALPNLPDSFCSFLTVSPQQVTNPLRVDFMNADSSATGLSLVGYSFETPDSFTASARYMQVTTYWKVNTADVPALWVQALLTDKSGKEEFSSIDFPSAYWCPTSIWKPGTIVRTTSRALFINNVPAGIAHVDVALLPLNAPLGTIAEKQYRLPLQIVSAPGTIVQAQGMNAIQIDTFNIVT